MKKTSYRLKKDIVIKKGTIFTEAPVLIENNPDCAIETIIGLTRNSSGTFLYYLDELDPQLNKWFEKR